MLTIEKHVTISPAQWEMVIEGLRNPKNSWDRSDSYTTSIENPVTGLMMETEFFLGEKDLELMSNLNHGGPVHAKYRRMMPVWVTINAPLYWWKEFDTYKVGTVANSCSTMHKIHAKEFTLDDFSHEHLTPISRNELNYTINHLNTYRRYFVDWDKIDDNSKNAVRVHDKKDCWWQMIQLLPSSYNQKRTVMLGYEVLTNIYRWRHNHKLDEWHTFCDWIEELPYSDLIIAQCKREEEPTMSLAEIMDIYNELKTFDDPEGTLSNVFSKLEQYIKKE